MALPGAKQFSVNAITLHRLLRRESIERAARYLRIVCLIVVSLVAIWTVQRVATDLLAQRSSAGRLESEISRIQTELQAQQQNQNLHKPQVNYDNIVKTAVFGEIGAVESAPVAPLNTPPPTQLKLSLIGTFITGGEEPYAIIEDQDKKVQEVFNIGDSIFDKAKLSAIFSDRVEIEHQGQKETLTLDDAPDSSGAAGGSEGGEPASDITVAEDDLNKALENLPLLLTQARAVPYFKDGKSIGLRLFAIKRGSLFENIGLRNGDILKTINGNSLADITQAVKLFETLKQERSISVVLERARVEQTFRYNIR